MVTTSDVTFVCAIFLLLVRNADATRTAMIIGRIGAGNSGTNSEAPSRALKSLIIYPLSFYRLRILSTAMAVTMITTTIIPPAVRLSWNGSPFACWGTGFGTSAGRGGWGGGSGTIGGMGCG